MMGLLVFSIDIRLRRIYIYSADIVEWLKLIVFSPDPNATTFYQDTQVRQTQASNTNV